MGRRQQQLDGVCPLLLTWQDSRFEKLMCEQDRSFLEDASFQRAGLDAGGAVFPVGLVLCSGVSLRVKIKGKLRAGELCHHLKPGWEFSRHLINTTGFALK